MREKNVARAICPPDEEPVTSHQSPGERILRCARRGRHPRCPIGIDEASVASHQSPENIGAVGTALCRPAFGTNTICRRQIPVFILLVLLIAWCAWSIHAITRDQIFQYEAERWQGPTDQRFCQVAVYLDKGELNATQAAAIETDMKTSFPEQETEAAIVTTYGSWEVGSAEYEKRKTDAELWQVSEGFFLLHSFPAASGGTGSFGQNGDEAVLNEAAAFALFGSFDCVGESIRIDRLGRRVIAIIKEPEGSANGSPMAGPPGSGCRSKRIPTSASTRRSCRNTTTALQPRRWKEQSAQQQLPPLVASACRSSGRKQKPSSKPRPQDSPIFPHGNKPPVLPSESSACCGLLYRF